MRKSDDGLRSFLRSGLPHLMWTTIETGLVQAGVPDAHVLLPPGIDVFVECKATDGWAVKFQPFQVGWLLRRARLGGLAWVAVRRRHGGGPRRGAAVDELWMVPGGLARALAAGGLLAVAAGPVGQGGPAGWPWAAVERLLRRPELARGASNGAGAGLAGGGRRNRPLGRVR